MSAMNGSQLTVYATQARRKGGITVVDWILEQTTRAGIVGATVFLATKAIDQHRKYHAAQFVELADETMAVTVAADDAKIDALISNLARSSTPLCYTRVPVEYGTLKAS
jgi:PII-like signaling protein